MDSLGDAKRGHCSTSPAQSQILKPCHSISFLVTLHPPNICRATCAAPVFFSCRVARSLAPSDSTRLLLLGHSLPGLPTQSWRHHVPSLHHGHPERGSHKCITPSAAPAAISKCRTVAWGRDRERICQNDASQSS